MSFFKKLFGGREAVPWENMPRKRTALEDYAAQFQKPGMMKIGKLEQHVTPEDQADSMCAFDVPAFTEADNTGCCFLRHQRLSPDTAGAVSESIRTGRVSLTATFHALPTYPIVAFLFQIPLANGPKKAEAVPDLILGDVRDAMDTILRDGHGRFFSFLGQPSRLLAEGRFTVSSVESLRRCLDNAATHYSRISPQRLDYHAAATEYIRTAPPL